MVPARILASRSSIISTKWSRQRDISIARTRITQLSSPLDSTHWDSASNVRSSLSAV
jgi:hypothetical protein